MPVCNTDQVVVIAHRGVGIGTKRLNGHLYTEDTIPAFKYAMRVGADGFETDYLPTRDGYLVSNHDDTLGRTTTGSGRVRSRSISYIRHQHADAGKHVKIPTFERVEMTMARYGGLRQQELKKARFTDSQLKFMIRTNERLLKDASCQVLYTASELRTLKRMKDIAKKVGVTVQVGYINRSGCGRPSLAKLPPFVDVIMVDSCAVTFDYVRAAKAQGHQVSARGVASEREFHRVVRAGVSRVVTDYPARMSTARNRLHRS